MSEAALKEQLRVTKEKLSNLTKTVVEDKGALLKLRKAAGTKAQELGAAVKKVKKAMNRRNLAITERNDLERSNKIAMREKEEAIAQLKIKLDAAPEADGEVTDWKPVVAWIGNIDDDMIDVVRKALSARAKTLREEAVKE